MKYENQKPDLADQVKALVQSANSVKTVPHGIKTVDPGEGLQLRSADGAEIFWDWETANTWDTRIQEGRAAIEQARADLDKAEQDLAAGAVRVDENRALLDALVPRVDSAEATVAQASKDLTALQGTVGDVAAKAAASEQKATDALSKAGAAQTSADGKTTITRALEPRTTQLGTAVGDTHFTMSSMGGGGVVTRQQRWDGSTWQDESLSHQVLASLDLGKATVGELDGIRVKARTLSADRFTVGVSGNLIVDPNFNDPMISGWRESGRWKWVDQSGEKCFSVVANGSYTDFSLKGTSATGPSIPVTSGVSYGLTMDVKGDVQVFLYIRYANGYVVSPGSSLQTLPGTGRRSATVAIRPDDYTHTNAQGTKPVELTLSVRCPSRAEVGSESAVYSARFAPRTSTVLIEDGAITGDKVEASTVSGAIGQFLKVEAQSGTFTDSLTGRNARLLGETVAESINITGKIRGRDAILTGTVDINQLNVTGEMSAQIARFMDAEARKLIVTEDAILNRATVVEGLVTSELISKKANIEDLAARMITSGLLQTTTDTNRGVKIDNAGIRAWDANGSQTVQINGRNNYLVGELSTAPDKQRVRLRSTGSIAAADFFGSNNTRDHLAIWHQADAGVDTVSKIIAHNDIAQVKGNPGMLMFPFRGEFAFTGRWAQESDSMKFFRYDDSRSLPGGGYMDITYTYTFPFTSQYTVTMPFLSMETATGRECVVSVMEMTYSTIKFRIVNKSAGDSGAFKVRGVIFNMNSYAYTKYE